MMNKIKNYSCLLLFVCCLGYPCISKEQLGDEYRISNKLVEDNDFENPIVGLVSETGEAILTKNKRALLERWNKSLLVMGIDGQLDEVVFYNDEGDYFLSAFSSKTDYVSNIGAFEKSGKLYLTTTSCTDHRFSDEKDRIPRGISCGSKMYCSAESTGIRMISTNYSPLIQVRLELDFLKAYFESKAWEVFWESD